jgi:hypothetical protein
MPFIQMAVHPQRRQPRELLGSRSVGHPGLVSLCHYIHHSQWPVYESRTDILNSCSVTLVRSNHPTFGRSHSPVVKRLAFEPLPQHMGRSLGAYRQRIADIFGRAFDCPQAVVVAKQTEREG